MSIVLLIASIAVSACSGTDLGAVCFTDMSAPLVYAFDTGSREALIIERFDDHTENTSYRIETSERNGDIIVEDAWIVRADGAGTITSRTFPPDYFTDRWLPKR
jgi:hypothetical protein